MAKYKAYIRVPVVSAAYRFVDVEADNPEAARVKLKECLTLEKLWGSDSKWEPDPSWEDADSQPWAGPVDIFHEYVTLVVAAQFDDDKIAELLRQDPRLTGAYGALEVCPL